MNGVPRTLLAGSHRVRPARGTWPMRAAAALIGCGLVAATLWSLPWYEAVRHSFVESPPPQRPLQVANPRAVAPNAEGVAQRALLGTQVSISPVREPLILVRTTPGRNAHEGLAQLGTSRENPQTYVAGALLLNGAQLAEIHADYVVLQRGKQSTRLYVSGGNHPAGRADTSELLCVGGGTGTTAEPR